MTNITNKPAAQKTVQRIVAYNNDPSDEFCLIITIEHTCGQLMPAIQNAVQEYCQTETGKNVLKHNNRAFNWGDLLDIPENICQKHRFKIIDSVTTNIVVNHNEQLAHEI